MELIQKNYTSMYFLNFLQNQKKQIIMHKF